MDAAEIGFAESGHNGASVRSIASEAGVTPAMIAYYFKSKQGLLDAVIKRRADVINTARRSALDNALTSARPELVDIITAFLQPAMVIGTNEASGGYAYIKLLAVLGNSMDAVSQRVITDNFNGVAQLFIAAIKDAVSELTAEGAARGYLYAFSVAMAAMGNEWRISKLISGGSAEHSASQSIEDVVAFACAGIQALARQTKEPPVVKKRSE